MEIIGIGCVWDNGQEFGNFEESLHQVMSLNIIFDNWPFGCAIIACLTVAQSKIAHTKISLDLITQ